MGKKTRSVTHNDQFVRCEGGQSAKLSTSMGVIFLCCVNNPSVDVRSVWDSPSGEKILVLEKLKKSKKMETETKATAIRNWWQLVDNAVSAWAAKFEFKVSIFVFVYSYSFFLSLLSF